MAAFIGFQNAVVIPGLRIATVRLSAPEALVSAVLVPSARGELRRLSISPGARFFHLALELSTPERYARYQCEMRSASGKPFGTASVSNVDVQNEVNLLIPARPLVPGDYEIILRGITNSGATELDRYRFEIDRPVEH
jgi:hypothetical protein